MYESATTTINQISLRIGAFLIACAVGSAWGQPAFSPPPPPQVDQSPVTSAGTPQPLEGGETIARVDGQIILASDVLWQVNLVIEDNLERIPPDKLQEFKRMLMRQQVMGLIDTKLFYAAFRRNVPAENVPSIEKNLVEPFEQMEVPRLMQMFKVENRSALAARLEELGTSLDDMQRQFNERTIAGEWIRQLTPKPQPATHQDLLDYYHAHSAEYEKPAQARWEELMIRFDRVGGDRTTAWEQICNLGNQMWQQAAANPGVSGSVFGDLAKKQSHGLTAAEGGGHDWTTQGALRASEIDAALFSLEVGQLSPPIETDQGFHIIRVLERKEAGRTPFSEAQADIRTLLEKDRKGDLIEAEVEKLRRAGRVWTIFDGDLSGPQLSELMRPSERR